MSLPRAGLHLNARQARAAHGSTHGECSAASQPLLLEPLLPEALACEEFSEGLGARWAWRC